MNDILVQVNHISKTFCRDFKTSLWYGLRDIFSELLGVKKKITLRKHDFYVLKDINFSISRGECVGIIGPNGAGKSTLLKLLIGLLKPESGYISVKGRVCALIQLTAGFNTLLTGRENIYIKGAILGMSKKEVDLKIEQIIDFSEIRDSIDSPVQTYSSGMVARLGFSIAVHTEPDVLVIDEVLAVGDAGFRNKCFAKIKQICENAAVIFISHNIHSVNRICNRIILMDQGELIHEYDNIATGIEKYLELFRKVTPKIEQKSHLSVNKIEVNKKELPKLSSVKFGGPLHISIEGDANKTVEVEVRLYFLSLNLENLAVVSSTADSQKLLMKEGQPFKVSIEVCKVMLGVEKAYVTVQISDRKSGERIYQNYAMTLLSITDHQEPFFSPNICEGRWSYQNDGAAFLSASE